MTVTFANQKYIYRLGEAGFKLVTISFVFIIMLIFLNGVLGLKWYINLKTNGGSLDGNLSQEIQAGVNETLSNTTERTQPSIIP